MAAARLRVLPEDSVLRRENIFWQHHISHRIFGRTLGASFFLKPPTQVANSGWKYMGCNVEPASILQLDHGSICV